MIAGLAVAFIFAAAPPAQRAVDLVRGEPAPYAGTLILKSIAFRCARCQTRLSLCEVTAKRDADKAAVLLKGVRAERDAEREGRLELEVTLHEATEVPPAEQPWYEYPVLWGGLGVVVGVGLTLLICGAVGAI